ncbi:MAG: signal peptidase II [Desulfobacteraceae bacterium]|nr:MAG: signal peptidase II [Desulfobacteraceae bacterium]
MKYIMGAGTATLVVALDQLTKWLVIRHLPFYSEKTIIPGFLNLIHIHNPGGAFGIFAKNQGTLQSLMFIGIALVAMILILYLYKKTPAEYPLLSMGLALIFGGAFGNLIDRLRIGKVIDFIDVHIRTLHWPAFNVADSAITVGMLIFAFYILFRKVEI